MPKPKDLPETMQDLAFRQAAPLDMRRDFHTHMDRLIGVIDELLKRGAGATQAGDERAPSLPEQQTQRATVKTEAPVHVAPQPTTSAPKATPAPERSLLQRIFLPDAERREAQSRVLAANWWMVAWRGVLALALGLMWFLGDAAYLSFLSTEIFAPLYNGSLLVFLLLDGGLAIASGWRGATPKSRFLPLIMNGMVELVLAAWVALQRLGMVRVATDTAPWPPPEFWMDIGIGFVLSGVLLLSASSGLNPRYGRVWLLASGGAVVIAGVFLMLTSTATELAWIGDLVMGGAGALLFVLAIQLQAGHLERRVPA